MKNKNLKKGGSKKTEKRKQLVDYFYEGVQKSKTLSEKLSKEQETRSSKILDSNYPNFGRDLISQNFNKFKHYVKRVSK